MDHGHNRHPSMSSFIKGGFQKDEMAAMCEAVQGLGEGIPNREGFLMTGRRPEEGQKLYLQVNYDHDGSHPEHYRKWGRFTGKVTEVKRPPEPGLYATYADQTPDLSPAQLTELRSHPSHVPLPPSFLHTCPCGLPHTVAHTIRGDGAVHGQRVRGVVQLSCDDEGLLVPQLAGQWDVELICNDTKQNIWELCAMAPANRVHNFARTQALAATA